ncbi:MAG: acyltransferase [bacterium]
MVNIATPAHHGNKSGRVDYWDAVRGIAIFCVIVIHAIGSAWYFVNDNSGAENLYFLVSLRQVVAFAVPVFLFMSGYFLRDVVIHDFPDYIAFLRKRLVRILVPYLLWSFVYIGYTALSTWVYPSILSVFTTLLLGQASGPFYFILLICQFYILLPLFLFLRKSTFGFVSVCILNILGIVALYAYTLITGSSPSLVCYGVPFFMWMIYFMIGINANKIYTYLRTPAIVITLVITLIIAVIESLYLMHISGENTVFATSSVRLGSMLYTIPIILLVLKLSKSRWSIPGKLVHLGHYSFGIYFIHMLILTFTSQFITTVPFITAHPMLYSIILTILTTVSCYAIGTVINRLLPRNFTKLYLGFGA